METEKAVLIKFVDLEDVPNDYLNHEGHTLVVNEDCTGLILGRIIKTEHVKAEGNILGNSLNIIKDAEINGTLVVKNIRSGETYSSCINSSKITTSHLETDHLKSQGGKIDVLETQNIQAVSLGTKSVVAQDVSVDNLRINQSIVLPFDTTAVDLHSKTLSVEDKASINELVSLVGSIDTLTSRDLLVNTLKVGTGLFDSVNTACLDSDLVVADKIHLRTSQKDGCKELPVVKDTFEGTLLPQISSKYVWYGKLKSPVNILKFKVNSVLDVLGDYVPVITFHPYENPVRLAENFKVDTFITSDTPDSFIVNLMFNNNLPSTTKFVLSIVLQRI